jgi:hypothetical protein
MLLVGSAAFTAVMGLILAALSVYGIFNMGAARTLLFIAWLIGVAGVVGSEIVCSKPWRHYVSIGLIFAIVFGGGLIWLDQWAVRTKAEQDRIAKIPPPILPAKITNTLPPAFALVKTPKPHAKPPSNIVIGNHNVTGNTITQGAGSIARVGGTDNITQIPAPCSVAQVGNNNTATVNCAPPSGTELAKFGAGTLVQIVNGIDSGSSNPIATGFWINNKGYIATCLHSLRGFDVRAFVPMPPLLGQNLTVVSGGGATGVEPVISDKETDIAILHVIRSPFERSMHGLAVVQQLDEQGHNVGKPEATQEQYWVPAIASDLAQSGDDVMRVAFIQQDGMPVVNYDFGHITRMGVDSSSGSTNKSYRLYTSVPFKDSDCGAPIINNAKTVIGMVRGSDGKSSVAIPSSYILDVLKTIKN